MKWIWIILALVYLLSPYDIIPGLSALGWLDDILVAFLLFRYLSKFSCMRQSSQSAYEQQQHEDAADARSTADPEETARTPYEILGVAPTASPDEIKSAYRRLVGQYHPDKVSYLGDEFRQLAEKRFKEIQDAYQKLTR